MGFDLTFLYNFPSKHFLFSKTSSRRLQDVFSVTLFVFQDVFKTYLQYVFLKRLQDVFARRLAIMSSRRLQYVLTKTNVCWVVRAPFFRTLLCRCFHFIYSLVMKSLWNKISYLHFLIFWGKQRLQVACRTSKNAVKDSMEPSQHFWLIEKWFWKKWTYKFPL